MPAFLGIPIATAADWLLEMAKGATMLLVVLLIILAIASGVLGVVIKGAFWLFVLTVAFLIGAFFIGRSSRNA